MAQYLLDTNILLRLSDPASPDQTRMFATIAQILTQGDQCCITAQVLIELWVVATRPTNVNGLGWTIEQTENAIVRLSAQFSFLRETEAIYPTWRNLVTAHRVKGKRTHDLRLIAVMQTHVVTHLLTLNPRDFPDVLGITIVHPQDLLNA
ncbi:PIN domain-containing protein [Cyanobacteria bacterium FACHB-DQ100]|nr:PIN domain-containing protein [Cyanobacteria bacterium FACHB-DQ100]